MVKQTVNVFIHCDRKKSISVGENKKKLKDHVNRPRTWGKVLQRPVKKSLQLFYKMLVHR